jgi:hypothetical protein
MRLSTTARKVHRVLKENGPRNLHIVAGLIGRDSTRADLARIVGELFIYGCVEWVGQKRGRKLAARGA